MTVIDVTRAAVCAWCGEDFIPPKPGRRFCSTSCTVSDSNTRRRLPRKRVACPECGTIVERRATSNIEYCGAVCAVAASNRRRARPIDERFWEKVDATGSCWLWTGSVKSNDYGSFSCSEFDTHYAHRIAYLLLVGGIPDGLDLDHLCRVRRCVNPDHLEPVTRRENLRRSPLVGKRSRTT